MLKSGQKQVKPVSKARARTLQTTENQENKKGEKRLWKLFPKASQGECDNAACACGMAAGRTAKAWHDGVFSIFRKTCLKLSSLV